MFISRAREGIIQDFVRGAPDLVVEVASPGTARYDRSAKVRWYRAYGVRECWLVDAQQQTVTVRDLSSNAVGVEFSNEATVRSSVLPLLSLAAGEILMTL
jgi:Uma2 family endonuclease